MTGAKKTLLILTLAVIVFGMLPLTVLPLPYDGLDWLEVADGVYEPTREPPPPTDEPPPPTETDEPALPFKVYLPLEFYPSQG